MLPVSLQLSGGHAVRLCQDWQHRHLLHQHALQTSAFMHLAAEPAYSRWLYWWVQVAQ